MSIIDEHAQYVNKIRILAQMIYAWEQRTLNEVADFFNEKRMPIDAGLRTAGEYPYYGATGIIDYVDGYIFNGEYVLLAEDGANIINRNNPIAYLTQNKFWLNNHAHIMRMKHGDNSFLLQLLEKQNYISLNTGTAQPKLNGEVVKKMSLVFPNTEEQTRIGKFFRTLDNTIAIHKRKLDGLQELKKAYLQVMFPQSGEIVPRLRFKGFTEPWGVRRLGDISAKVSEKNKDNTHVETLTNSAEHGIISQRDFFDKDISNERNLGTYFVVQPDDFVYNPRISNFAPVGPIKRNSLGRAGVMSPLYYVFRITKGDLTFIEKFFESSYWHEFMKMNGDNGVRADRFNIKDSTFEQMPIPCPGLDEQKAIGQLLGNLDLMIADFQSKVEKLANLKSAYLQKMFV